jgi:hypothetical protein
MSIIDLSTVKLSPGWFGGEYSLDCLIVAGERARMKSRIGFLCLVLFVFDARAVLAQQPTGTTVHDLFEQDQRDEQIDIAALPPTEQKKVDGRYPVREKLVIERMQNGGIHSPQDLFEAGVVLTHSHNPEHQLLAHVLFTAAAFQGITEAKHLAATSLDRYLMFAGKTSMFGTTFQIPYKGWHHDVSADMNDSLRSSFCIPPLKRLDQRFEEEKRGTPAPNTGHDEFWDTQLKGCQ